MAAVRHLGFWYFRMFVKNSNARLFLRRLHYLVKIGWPTAELLRIFNFQNGVHPLSWNWYDVIADHPRFVFDGPNILLKLHVDRVYTLQDIAIFIFGLFGLKLPFHTPFWGSLWVILPLNEIWYCRNPQKDCPWVKTRHMSHKLWKSIHGFDMGMCPIKKQYNQLTK